MLDKALIALKSLPHHPCLPKAAMTPSGSRMKNRN